MINKSLKYIFAVFIALSLMSFDIPKGWYATFSNPGMYDIGVDYSEDYNGKKTATVKSGNNDIYGVYGGMLQSCLAAKFLGKRVTLSVAMKSEHVKEWSGFIIKVINDNKNEVLSMDDMQDRPITGSTEWKMYQLTFDVPLHATTLVFGAMLYGSGQIWFSNIRFEVIGEFNYNTKIVAEPYNLNFDEKNNKQ